MPKTPKSGDKPSQPAHVEEPRTDEPDVAADPAAGATQAEPLAGDATGTSGPLPPLDVPEAPLATSPSPTPLPPTISVAPPAYTPLPPPASHRGGAGTAIGVMLVVVGLFFLVVRLLGIDLSGLTWPLIVILPGLTLLVVGFVSLGTGAAVPGGVVTMVGLALAYQNATQDWASWTWVWPLVAPGGVGLGIYLRGLRSRNRSMTHGGLITIFVGVMISMACFVFFETFMRLSSNVIDYGWVGDAVLPTLLIVLGIVLLARNLRGRQQG